MSEIAALHLVPLDAALLGRLVADPVAWAAESGIDIGGDADLVRSVAQATVTHHGGADPPLPWAGYLALDPADRRPIGTCAFKAPPGDDAAVEIAYFTFPDFEGRGYARAMARSLLEIASAEGGVRTVRAHTLPEANASGRILTRLGFANLGAVIDPEDGTVWRWERPTYPQETR